MNFSFANMAGFCLRCCCCRCWPCCAASAAHGPAFVYSSVALVKEVSKSSRSRAGAFLHALRWLALALLIVALARPQKTQTDTSVRASGVDIVIALDLSGSMESEDFEIKGQRVNRLVVAKDTVAKFIEKRPNDRIGLVAFAGKPYIAAPLTLDHDFLRSNLERLNLHTIEDGTAIGAGLAAAVNRLRDVRSKSKIVILMTDGQNNAGKIPPLTAAEAAKALDMKVYTIGVGIRGQAPFPQQTPFGKRYVMMNVDIDEPTLTADRGQDGRQVFSRGQHGHAAQNLRRDRSVREDRGGGEEVRATRRIVSLVRGAGLGAAVARTVAGQHHLEEIAVKKMTNDQNGE